MKSLLDPLKKSASLQPKPERFLEEYVNIRKHSATLNEVTFQVSLGYGCLTPYYTMLH